jgi:quercetin dioxygenase-like cupin family protein
MQSPFPNRGFAAMPASARPTLQIDNERVRVTEWRFAPGATTGWHRHELDYVVVPLYDGRLRLVEPKGTREVSLRAGVSYTRPAGVEHEVINANDFEFAFVEVELK